MEILAFAGENGIQETDMPYYIRHAGEKQAQTKDGKKSWHFADGFDFWYCEENGFSGG